MNDQATLPALTVEEFSESTAQALAEVEACASVHDIDHGVVLSAGFTAFAMYRQVLREIARRSRVVLDTAMKFEKLKDDERTTALASLHDLNEVARELYRLVQWRELLRATLPDDLDAETRYRLQDEEAFARTLHAMISNGSGAIPLEAILGLSQANAKRYQDLNARANAAKSLDPIAVELQPFMARREALGVPELHPPLPAHTILRIACQEALDAAPSLARELQAKVPAKAFTELQGPQARLGLVD